MSGNDQVRVEMQTFLQALTSYVDRAAHDPSLTFEELQWFTQNIR